MPTALFAALLLNTAAAAAPASPFAEAEAAAAQVKSPASTSGFLRPAYSDADKAAGRRGNVFLRMVIGSDGAVLAVEIERSNAPPELEAAALAAARTLRFRPALDQAGKPIISLHSHKAVFAAAKLDPDFERREEEVYDPQERALGHFGKVVIAGRIGADGKLIEPVVDRSSRAPALDGEAMRAATASSYRPYHDAAGRPVAAPIKVGYAFDSYRSPGQGGGVLRYGCDQFARDHIWWKEAWPGKERSEFYSMMLGLGVLVEGRLSNPGGLVAYTREFEGRWEKAIEACRKKPDKLFIDVFKPEGDYARKLASVPEPKRDD